MRIYYYFKAIISGNSLEEKSIYGILSEKSYSKAAEIIENYYDNLNYEITSLEITSISYSEILELPSKEVGDIFIEQINK